MFALQRRNVLIITTKTIRLFSRNHDLPHLNERLQKEAQQTAPTGRQKGVSFDGRFDDDRIPGIQFRGKTLNRDSYCYQAARAVDRSRLPGSEKADNHAVDSAYSDSPAGVDAWDEEGVMTDGQSETGRNNQETPSYIGIDPGASGGMVWYASDFVEAVRFSKSTWADVRDSLMFHPAPFALIERVASMPGQGVSSTFKFGKSAGVIEGILIALRIPFEYVTPAVWQKEFIVSKKGESKTDHKRRLKEAAQRLFPDEKICNEIADAYLIAEYCRRRRTR